MDIQWYPGHMAKASRMMQNNLKLVNIIIEVLDARAALASRNPDFEELLSKRPRLLVLNKADLAEQSATREWVEYYKSQGLTAIAVNSLRKDGIKQVAPVIQGILSDKLASAREKGVKKTVRAMVCGMPNVGKSAFINAMAGSSGAVTGNMPGVTKGKQWVRVNQYLELLDTPGVLVPKIDNENFARHLGYIGSIKDDILPLEDLACEFLAEMYGELKDVFKDRYGIDENRSGVGMLETLCRHRGFLLKKGEVDYERAAKMLFVEFRSGKLGRISIERSGNQ